MIKAFCKFIWSIVPIKWFNGVIDPLEMSELVQIHSIGYNLTDVKVEFKKDTVLDVSGVSIKGKVGEILNIPRWSAEVLESTEVVTAFTQKRNNKRCIRAYSYVWEVKMMDERD